MYIWDKDKSKRLARGRGVSFNDVKKILLADAYLDILDNPFRDGQFIYLIVIHRYVHVVPFVIDKRGNIILKTVYPSRKYHKLYKGSNYMKPPKKAFLLTKEEKEIEKDIEAGLYVPVSSEKRKLIEMAMRKAKKDETISLRLNGPDLIDIKQVAVEEGLPYQTLISSILHKYVTNQLIEDRAVKKVVSVLKTK